MFLPHHPLCCCHQDRVPFVVPERVPWRLMYNTLNSKFTSEVQTQHNLDTYNQHFLAQKIFDKSDFADDLSNMMVSWAQFNKVHSGVCPLVQKYIDRHSHSNHTVISALIGGPSRSTFHFLAVVWGSNGADQETSENLLEWRVSRYLHNFSGGYSQSATVCNYFNHL